MAQILVRNLENEVKTRLQRRAERNGRSMEEKVREILCEAAENERGQRKGLGTEIANLFRGLGQKPGEEIQELRDIKLQIPDFEE